MKKISVALFMVFVGAANLANASEIVCQNYVRLDNFSDTRYVLKISPNGQFANGSTKFKIVFTAQNTSGGTHKPFGELVTLVSDGNTFLNHTQNGDLVYSAGNGRIHLNLVQLNSSKNYVIQYLDNLPSPIFLGGAQLRLVEDYFCSQSTL